MIFDIYLKGDSSKKILVTAMEKIFNLSSGRIGHLLDEGEYEFFYSYEVFGKKNSFYKKIELYPPNDLLLQTGMYNELIFGMAMSKILREEVIISDHSDDPYRWILINPNGNIFLIEEDATYEGPEIILDLSISPCRLSHEKVLQLFPGKEYLLSGKQPETIPSKILEGCIIE